MAARHKADTEGGGRDWKRLVILGGIGLIAAVLLWLAAAAWIPRWWSHRMGQAVSSSMTTGVLLGLCFGLVFSILPLTLLWLTMRRRMSWKLRGVWVLAAAVLAAPNLFTLGVAVGTGNGAHAGQRTMDVEAPMFRGSTLIGALAAVLIFMTVVIMFRRRGRVPKAPKVPQAPAAA
jgi:hypothetical protein